MRKAFLQILTVNLIFLSLPFVIFSAFSATYTPDEQKTIFLDIFKEKALDEAEKSIDQSQLSALNIDRAKYREQLQAQFADEEFQNYLDQLLDTKIVNNQITLPETVSPEGQAAIELPFQAEGTLRENIDKALNKAKLIYGSIVGILLIIILLLTGPPARNIFHRLALIIGGSALATLISGLLLQKIAILQHEGLKPLFANLLTWPIAAFIAALAVFILTRKKPLETI